MVDFNKIAIADCLKHPEFGVVSHQPGIEDPIENQIKVRDINFKLRKTLASECKWASLEEIKQYWHQVSTIKNG